ncbi:MAG: hypothetical protein HZA35_03525 [Parcubacteria group bacterium]|nr:hypothetical protein [Parcubacteria group bacterium]
MKGIINPKAVLVLFIWFLALNALMAMTFCVVETNWLVHTGYYALWIIFAWVTYHLFPKE